MSIASEITRLQNIKADIRSALVTQGVPAASGHDMADFSADILSISTGGGATITVTYSSDFYGSTITATNGSKTVTKVAPSTGSAEIKVSEEGIWTISAPAHGQTFSTTVTVVLSYASELTAIPNGATVTPTDNIQIWLHCGNIWDKNYTTISQVLSDTTTLLALISSNNAADYMARSTSWANSVCGNSTAMTYIGNNNYCANKLLSNSTWASAICNSTYFESVLNVKVPTMTSNTTPSGKCSAGEENARAYYAFDGNSSTKWYSGSGASGTVTYIGYQFPSAVKIYKWGFAGNTDSPLLAPTKVVIQKSNDGVTYTDVQTFDNLPNDGQFHAYIFTTPTNAKYWRAQAYKRTVSGNTYAQFSRLQFYGRTP